jgi:hypothetical protein
MSHTVKIHRWINGMLKIATTTHETLEQAIEHARHMTRGTGHTAKVYGEDGEISHTISEIVTDTYA